MTKIDANISKNVQIMLFFFFFGALNGCSWQSKCSFPWRLSWCRHKRKQSVQITCLFSKENCQETSRVRFSNLRGINSWYIFDMIKVIDKIILDSQYPTEYSRIFVISNKIACTKYSNFVYGYNQCFYFTCVISDLLAKLATPAVMFLFFMDEGQYTI